MAKRNLPTLRYTTASRLAAWSNYHHTITGRAVGTYLTPGIGSWPVPVGKQGGAALARDLSAILSYCMTDPPERLCILGSRWSLSNTLDPASVVLDPGVYNQLAFVDPAWLTHAYQARASARGGGKPVIAQGGVNIGVLNNALGAARLALQTSGASDGHRLAGCIATGTHGSDLKVGAVHDAVLALYLVVSPGQAVLLQPSQRYFTPDLATWFQESTSLANNDIADDDLFNAARVALGALGFVHSVIIEAVPLYELTGVTLQRPLYDAEVWRAMETLDTAALDPRPSPDFFSVVLSPFSGSGPAGAHPTLLWKQPTERPFEPPNPVVPPISSDLSRLLSALIPVVDGGAATALVGSIITSTTASQYQAGPVAPIFPGSYFGPTSLPEGNGHSSEVVVDHRDTVAAVKAVLFALQAEAAAGRHLLGAIGVRFVPGTTALLGMNIHPMNTYIEFPSLNSADTTQIQQAVWSALRAAVICYTCHWGQEYGMDAASVLSYYGDRIARWQAARAKLLSTPAARAVFSTPLIGAVGLDQPEAVPSDASRELGSPAVAHELEGVTSPLDRMPTIAAAHLHGRGVRELLPDQPPVPDAADRRRQVAEACQRSLSSLRDPHLGGHVEVAPRCRLVGGVFVTPDLAVWRGGGSSGDTAPAAPTMCVEVLTPETARDVRLVKLALYAQAGVEWIWIVDPAQESVEIYRGRCSRATLIGGSAGPGVAALEPFAGEISLAPWWSAGP